ncbi:MAG: GNAT family N-acetyltransferase [Cellulosilyticaceae bacterium]
MAKVLKTKRGRKWRQSDEVKFDTVSIGRVIVAEQYRKEGYGKVLLQKALDYIQEKWGEVEVEIEAQAHLQKFYGDVGFRRTSDEYLEDGIPHVRMVREGQGI